MSEKARRAAQKRRREIAHLRADNYMGLLNALEARGAPKAALKQVLATVTRDLEIAEGRDPDAGEMQRAIVKRSVGPAAATGRGARSGPLPGGVLSGYAAVFDSLSVDLGGYVERIAPGAFTRSLTTGKDIKMLLDHDSGVILGSTAAGTLKLWEDRIGLAFEVDAGTDRTYAADAVRTVDRGDLRSMSFGFYVKADDWKDGAQLERLLREVDLFEVSAVAFPAYPSARVAVGAARRARPAPGRGDWRAAAAQRRRDLEVLALA